jgi:LuxR family transcriptional regulator, maltose regulon positive regulatory protein
MAVSRHVYATNGFELVHLTPRQRQVLALVALEYNTEDIARLIDREPKTVEGHLASIYQKLHVHSRVGAVLKAMNLGELPSDADKLLRLAKLDQGVT